MKSVKNIFLIVSGLLFCTQASAATSPFATLSYPSFKDTTLSMVVQPLSIPVVNKKANFLSKLKNKFLSSVLKKYIGNEPKDKKKTLGLISIGLIVLGFGLMALISPGIGILLLVAGLTTGIIALSGKEDKGEPKTNKKKTARIIGIIVAGGLLLGLIIALATWKMH
jgi:hypothetical protein